jgi:hypothetical protein
MRNLRHQSRDCMITNLFMLDVVIHIICTFSLQFYHKYSLSNTQLRVFMGTSVLAAIFKSQQRIYFRFFAISYRNRTSEWNALNRIKIGRATMEKIAKVLGGILSP